MWWQVPIIPFLKVLTSLSGIVATGAAKNAYGTAIWNPVRLLPYWTSPSGRLAAFASDAIWVLAQLCCNVSANVISLSNDLTTICPKWINIKRGAIVRAIFGGWAMVPWVILSSASTFLNFMSGYALFLGPFASMMLCDYWIVKKRHIDVPALYDPAERYTYTWGMNWRAVLTEAVVVGPLFLGLAKAINSKSVEISPGLSYLYAIHWIYGFVVSIFAHWLLNLVFPAKDTIVPNNNVWPSGDIGGYRYGVGKSRGSHPNV